MRIFDTESRDPQTAAPPRGHCHVLVELGPSGINPDKADGKSYGLVGLFACDEPHKAKAHVADAQEAENDEAATSTPKRPARRIVAFDAHGKVLAKGKPATFTPPAKPAAPAAPAA